jgi:phosphoribosyl-ATP pyrophosphohydrolase
VTKALFSVNTNHWKLTLIFFTKLKSMKTFDQLFAELSAKVAAGDTESGTVTAIQGGVHTVGKKVVEEAAEAWMAAEHESKERAAQEISQLLYWTQALMITAEVTLDDVYREL